MCAEYGDNTASRTMPRGVITETSLKSDVRRKDYDGKADWNGLVLKEDIRRSLPVPSTRTPRPPFSFHGKKGWRLRVSKGVETTLKPQIWPPSRKVATEFAHVQTLKEDITVNAQPRR